jgi:SH3-like domain-containing protein
MARQGKGFGFFLAAAGLAAVWFEDSENVRQGSSLNSERTSTTDMLPPQPRPSTVQTFAALPSKKQDIQHHQSITRPVTTQTVYVNARNLNVRSEPSLDASVLGKVKQGTPLAVTATSSEWFRVGYGQGSGWVHGRYVTARLLSTVPHRQPALTQSRRTSNPTDGQIIQALISRSLANYLGRCPCPYNTMSNGRRCGGRSAYSRPGGRSPLCYPQDVSAEMIADFRKTL